MKYRVSLYQDDEYEVYKEFNDPFGPLVVLHDPNATYYTSEESVFKGSLSDCEAYIRLHEQGYM